MTYLRHISSSRLNDYIDYLYYLDGRMASSHEKILPLPTLDLKINLGGALQVYENDHTDTYTESWCVGVWRVPHTVDWPSDLRLFGVHFKPDGAYPFLHLPLSELHNRVVTLDAIWGQFAAELRERLYAAPTIQSGFALLERLLLERLEEAPPGLEIVRSGITQMARQHGIVSIRDLSDSIGISQNHLGTHFKRFVGVSAKELAQLYRFEYSLHMADPIRPVEWTRVALRSGYYDLSHLNKEFLAFSGHSPTDYLRLRRRAYAEDPERAQTHLRNLPID
ncbi:MAG TPA: helix-turn-helix domain-containing protein [Aggregatilineaceae bacterium]|nr:helix-turn-helix domain-containing protein [Aggregatilineaceae bacterium]